MSSDRQEPPLRARTFYRYKILRIAFSLALLAAVVGFADWRSVARVLESVHPGWIGLATLLALGDRLIMNYRWQLLLRARGVRSGFGCLFRVQLAANFLGSFVPASVGVDAVRMMALCRAGEPAPLVIGATLVDRATIVLATLVVGSIAALPLASQTHVSVDLQHAVIISTLTAVGLSALMLVPTVRRVARVALVSYVPQRVADRVTPIADAALAYRGDRRLLLGVGLVTLALFMVRIAFVKVLLLACGVDVSVEALALTIPILWIVVMLPITVGGLGVQDAGYVALLGLVGVSAPIAVAVSLLEHVISRLISLPGAFLVDLAFAPPGRQKEEEGVNNSVSGRAHQRGQPAWVRIFTDGGYRARLFRYALGLPTPLSTADRQVLETVIFRYYAGKADIRSVLFVGCDWYTRHYDRAYFQCKNYWTLDPARRARKFGARQHVMASLEDLGAHFPPGYFDLIICNGVYGYGLDSRSQCERAFDACYRALRERGSLIIGWDDIPQRTPVPLEEIDSLARFAKVPFPPLGCWRYATDTPYRHTYDFYRIP